MKDQIDFLRKHDIPAARLIPARAGGTATRRLDLPSGRLNCYSSRPNASLMSDLFKSWASQDLAMVID